MWVNTNGTAVWKKMCAQQKPEWKYAPQANALTWITKMHINCEHINAEDSMGPGLCRSMKAQDGSAIMDQACVYLGVLVILV